MNKLNLYCKHVYNNNKSKAKANIAIRINKQYIAQTCPENTTLY